MKKNLLLGVTGSVAALKTPELYRCLSEHFIVKIASTEAALYFFDHRALPEGVLHRDADEWPRRDSGTHYQREDPVMHIELRRWADLFLIAPLDANTLAKLAFGLADNLLTCIYRAWDLQKPLILAPAMNTLMWEHPLTAQHLCQLMGLYQLPAPPAKASVDELVAWVQKHGKTMHIVGPISKKLACGDIGMGAMAEVKTLVDAVLALLFPPATNTSRA